ncbi:MAG: Fic family protein [Oscillospiraceae bacterium]|nr:Fic family protein [Oscillospiraceae bacterium]
MGNYIPPYQISDKMLQYVSSISEKVGQITERSNMESKPHLRRNNKIKSIHSSLRIEANSLSLDEVRDVINGRMVLGAAKEIQEVKNAYEAYDKLSSIDPFSLDDLKRSHGIMTRYIEGISGEFRLGEEGVFNGDQCIFMAPPARLVPSQMQDLFDWMKRSRGSVHPLIMAAVFHYEFVFIHPFTDGNGRMARLWHTAILMQWKSIFEYIPIESQIEKFQDGYYQAIADSHIAGNSNCFIEFMLAQIDAVLDEIRAQTAAPGTHVSKYVKRLLEVMEYDTAYSANDILALLDLKSKETLRRNYLGPAIGDGLVIMTIPDKPNSKNQRYVKV